MIKCVLSGVALLFCCALFAQSRELKPGMKITKSMTIRKSAYTLASPTGDTLPIILIEGDNITVDFNHATLRSRMDPNRPDSFRGVAIIIRNSKKVSIRNLNVHGYRIAVHAINVQNLVLENCDLSYNYRPRLLSTPEKENMADWMSYHHNEKNEWLRYGAAIYLEKCDKATVRKCRVTGGQNALMITQTNNSSIYDNDFSFNSGIGIGMYRSSNNSIMHNRIIFNVRGYSHGVYQRGQDSAGILMYEQSSNNLVYKNNVTHGGDGLFLWAGQTTMDTGQGGCNDNLIIGNDFSYAPTNGIEVTFSRNQVISNRIFECTHGIWGGYSYETQITGNQFRNNRTAIAIEHGQDNTIHNNLFIKDREAIRLWSRKQQPADWGYATNRDTRSRNYVVVSNSFNDHEIVYNITGTDTLNIFDNTYSTGIKRIFKTDSSVMEMDTSFSQYWYDSLSVENSYPTPDVPHKDPFKGAGRYAGRKNIIITEWGPYDFQSPLIRQTNPAGKSDTLHFEILGPAGTWTVKEARGIDLLTSRTGNFPAQMTGTRTAGDRTDILVELVYNGPSFTTAMGKVHPAKKPWNFSFRKYFQPIDWDVRFFSLDTAYHNPITTGSLFSPLERKAPFKLDTTSQLDYAWWGGIAGHKQFITMADGRVEVPGGDYEIRVTWDDAVRVYLDNELIMDEWSPGKYSFDQSPHRAVRLKLGGEHRFRVEHVELGGFAVLALELKAL